MSVWNIRSSWYIDVTTSDKTIEEAEELIGLLIDWAMSKAQAEGLITWYDLDCQVNNVEEA